MYNQRRMNDSVHWYMDELIARVVAESGRACDRFHLGKLILRGLKDAPEFTLQVNGLTGESDTCSSVLERSIKCANSFKELGMKHGDVIVLMAPYHLNLAIPYYAAMYVGISVAPIDRLLKIKELKHLFAQDEPKIVFCQSERAKDVQSALNDLNLDTKVVTFDDACGNEPNIINFDDLLKSYELKTSINDFRASDFNPEDTVATLLSTSGTTGLPKQASLTHKNFAISGPFIWYEYDNLDSHISKSRWSKFPTPIKMPILMSPLQWLSAIVIYNMAPYMRYTLLMTPIDISQEHFYSLVNTYKPDFMMVSPTKLATLIDPATKDKCDITCFDTILIGGSTVSPDFVNHMKRLSPKTHIHNAYGISELSGMGFMWDNMPESCGKLGPHLQYRLVSGETLEDVLEPRTPGELWLKGPSVFTGYYKNDDATRNAFSEDGWFKTGDIFYRDEQYNFFFVERMKLLLKYMNHQISPAEIQNVIFQHPGVQDVAVTGVADVRGDLVVACVVRRNGHQVTAQEIKDLVKESLTDSKQLRGGVVFLEKIPVTSTTKIDYRRLKEIVAEMERV